MKRRFCDGCDGVIEESRQYLAMLTRVTTNGSCTVVNDNYIDLCNDCGNKFQEFLYKLRPKRGKPK